MNPLVTNAEKKRFLEWFLQSYELQKREGAWLLTYIMSDDNLLAKVRFVDEIDAAERSIIMSTKCTDGVSFQFRKGDLQTTDVEKAFYDLRHHPDQILQIKLNYKSAQMCPEYAAVKEDGPMKKQKLTSNGMYALLAEMVLDEAVYQFKKQQLRRKINEALDQRDKERFLQLSEQWLKLVSENE
ncbi:Uncharacterized protein family UPF0302 [Caldalkalibacillus thermarum TA2.A1]|uniref:ReoY family proteolytic degradation factor n=1 Tax=Caldalkalibacillus thermarum (strain TA2.A1) TaxID=986075 RepID=F5L8X8_CALTT|nr:ReoY family proteolytic degradation factor [Caldalkalibacillus thermarum]EGL82260.1 Uncharacterized protein family UPF0302 [Caldalkalibacillus thermarum TA2.A1]QZT32727.1 ReoY family proteolytic degradation factor [Caldalkalibacillus thermarum TA2.A1]